MKQADFTTKQLLAVIALGFFSMVLGISIGWNISKGPSGAVFVVVIAGMLIVVSIILFIMSLIWPEEKHPPPPP